MVMVHTIHTVDMFTTRTNLKKIYNEATHHEGVLYELSPEESSMAKATLVGMYKDLAALCHDNDLTLMLGGGSCLGAVRHKGFIPWDDDIDLMMPRESYTRLIGLLREGAMGEEYEFACPGEEEDAPCTFLKIYKKGTQWIELGRENTPYPKGLFLDIFPLDGAPRNVMMQRTMALLCDTLRGISTCVHGAWLPMSEAKKSMLRSSTKTMLIIHATRFAGKILSIVPHRAWLKAFDILVSDVSTDGFMTSASGRNHYFHEILPASVFLPPRVTTFEGETAFLPNDYDAYLSKLYSKDYMTPPSEEDKERHFLVSKPEFFLGKRQR